MPTSHPTDRNSQRQHNFEQDYERWLYESLDSGNYFQFRRDYLAFLSSDAAIILQSLLNLAKHRNAEGWILATSAYMESQLYKTKRVIDRVIRELKDGGFIDVEVRGLPPLRYIRINLIHLGRRLDEVKADRLQLHPNVPIDSTQTYHNKSIPTEYSNKSNKHCRLTDSAATPPRRQDDGSEDSTFSLNIPGQDNHRPRRAGGSVSSKQETPSPQARGYAARLHDKVVAAGLSQHKKCRPDKWAVYFDQLEEKGVPASTIAHVFDWLMEHFGEQYVPIIESGKSFYEKFDKLLAAIERDKKANPQVTISPDAEKVANSLTTYFAWPKGSETQLPTVVQLSLDRIAKLIEKLESKYLPPKYQVNYLSPHTSTADGHSKSLPTDIQVAHAIWRRLDLAFVREWFEQVHKRIATWDKWNGQLKPFDPKSKEFRVFAQSWTQSKCSDPNLCDHILKEISK